MSMLGRAVSLLLLGLGWAGLAHGGNAGGFEPYPYYQLRMDLFAATPLTTRDIVFLGDSITEGGEWSELFPDLPVRDRGIGGDTTAGVLARLSTVTGAQPVAIFLMIGTNDLSRPGGSAASLANYREIIDRIGRESPGTRLFVQSVLPRAAAYRALIEAYNRAIASVCRDPACSYVDLYGAFLGPEGALRAELTADGLHLNGRGYQLWQSLLAPRVGELPLPAKACGSATDAPAGAPR